MTPPPHVVDGSYSDADRFRNTMSRFASGVTVVTATAGSAMEGATVSSFCSVSLEPPLVLVCLARTSSTHDAIDASGSFAVNILARDNEALARHFASRGHRKLAGLDFDVGRTGSALLRGVLGFVECRVVSRVPAGDHTAFIGHVLATQVSMDRRPLLYFDRDFREVAPAPDPRIAS